jgi:mRNA-degrading endonuclease RelE of RelBE toxin-antitoxin system
MNKNKSHLTPITAEVGKRQDKQGKWRVGIGEFMLTFQIAKTLLRILKSE